MSSRIRTAIVRRGVGWWGCLLLWMAVVMTACAPRPAPPPPPVPPSSESAPESIETALPRIHFTIQVGAFSTTYRAAQYADRLEADGLDAYYFVDTDSLCKVRFERFDTKEAARERALDLQARGVIDGFYIVQPGVEGPRPDPRVALREDLVTTAHRFIGTPYRWGGTSAKNGFDCSGLTMTIYRLNGLELPRNAASQYRSGTSVSRRKIERGDLVFFATGRSSRISHVGIYTGDGKFIHAPGRGKTIRTASLSNSYFRKRYRGARRYF